MNSRSELIRYNATSAIKQIEHAKQYGNTYGLPQQHLLSAAQDTIRMLCDIGIVLADLLDALRKDRP